MFWNIVLWTAICWHAGLPIKVNAENEVTLLFPAEFANSSGRVKASNLWMIRSPQQVQVCDRMQLVWTNMRMSTCNNILSIVYDLHRFLYIQLMDTSGWLDFPKLNGTNGIRKARKWLCQCDMTKISSVQHGAVLHRFTSPCTESTRRPVSTASGQTCCSVLFLRFAYSIQSLGIFMAPFIKQHDCPARFVSSQTLLSYCKKDDRTVRSQDSASIWYNPTVFLRAGDKPTFSREHSLCYLWEGPYKEETMLPFRLFALSTRPGNSETKETESVLTARLAPHYAVWQCPLLL